MPAPSHILESNQYLEALSREVGSIRKPRESVRILWFGFHLSQKKSIKRHRAKNQILRRNIRCDQIRKERKEMGIPDESDHSWSLRSMEVNSGCGIRKPRKQSWWQMATNVHRWIHIRITNDDPTEFNGGVEVTRTGIPWEGVTARVWDALLRWRTATRDRLSPRCRPQHRSLLAPMRSKLERIGAPPEREVSATEEGQDGGGRISAWVMEISPGLCLKSKESETPIIHSSWLVREADFSSPASTFCAGISPARGNAPWMAEFLHFFILGETQIPPTGNPERGCPNLQCTRIPHGLVTGECGFRNLAVSA